MSNSSPWDVTANVGVAQGYSETVCISCENDKMTVVKDGWQITQESGCSNVLSSPSETANLVTIAHVDDFVCVNDDIVVDSYGDTCTEYYDDSPYYCGGYDTDTFVASIACCVC